MTVRSEVQIDYLVDGPDTAAANQVVDRFATSPTGGPRVSGKLPAARRRPCAPPVPGALAH